MNKYLEKISAALTTEQRKAILDLPEVDQKYIHRNALQVIPGMIAGGLGGAAIFKGMEYRSYPMIAAGGGLLAAGSIWNHSRGKHVENLLKERGIIKPQVKT
jgi:hypothetical protein